MGKGKRYFYVCYTAQSRYSDRTVNSNTLYVTGDGEYVNKKKFLDHVVEYLEKSHGLYIERSTVLILNIIELSESDYNNFIEE